MITPDIQARINRLIPGFHETLIIYNQSLYHGTKHPEVVLTDERFKPEYSTYEGVMHFTDMPTIKTNLVVTLDNGSPLLLVDVTKPENHITYDEAAKKGFDGAVTAQGSSYKAILSDEEGEPLQDASGNFLYAKEIVIFGTSLSKLDGKITAYQKLGDVEADIKKMLE